MTAKQRIDILMCERGLAASREKARAMIMAGEVVAGGQPITKPGTTIALDTEIVVKNKPRFVSRGGEKLAWAIETFQLDVHNTVCADVGASTGGFTDCLLQNGASSVYAIDVGYGQIDFTLRQDSRVHVIERTNARFLESLPEPVNFVSIDASFISLKLLLPTIKNWLSKPATIIPLIKPQFEAGRSDVGKGGVVRDSKIHRRVLVDVLTFAQTNAFQVNGLATSPIKGPAGNIEFLAWLTFDGTAPSSVDLDALITPLLS
ncbi:MAG: TlyA family RNA methyltransferase [Chloroflexi bacterium]|nr:TlyA family RNA methyltransferase [Chloroflexota bacterium]MCC6891331.1 TlyA family RNA methyltransferase [Anaerolineae bacterium]